MDISNVTNNEGAIVGAIIDVATTGNNYFIDEIIELGIILFSYNTLTKNIVIIDEYSGLREPACIINPEASRANGLTYNDVKNMKLDYPQILYLLDQAELIIAHNVSFNWNFVTQMIPEATQIPWYCSMRSINWTKYGCNSRSLQYLLSEHKIDVEIAQTVHSNCLSLFDLLSLNDANYLLELLNNQPFAPSTLLYKQDLFKSLRKTAVV